MNYARASAALNTASLALAELAEALIEQPGSERTSGVVAAMPATTAPADLPPSFDELAPDEPPADWGPGPLGNMDAHGNVTRDVPQGSLTSCPKHHVLYRKGKYGMYCPSTSDDPAWRNDKGFCKITPRNAAAWLAEAAA